MPSNILDRYLPFLNEGGNEGENGGEDEEERRLGPFKSQVHLGTRRQLSEAGVKPSTFKPDTVGDSKTNFGEALSQTSLAQGGTQPKGEDIIKGITEDVDTRRKLLAQLIYFGGFGKGAGGQIKKLLQREEPSLLDALNVGASQGIPYTAFPIHAPGIGNVISPPGKKFQMVNIGGQLQGVFVDDEVHRIREFLKQLGEI